MSESDARPFLGWGREVLEAEASALTLAAQRLSSGFCQAVETLLQRRGKVVVTGLGKSGHVARKVSSTLASTGTPAIFLHPAEALHGDFGMIQEQDFLVALAFGGETPEVLEVVRFARRMGVPVLAITGSMNSSLAQAADFVLDGGVEREACPLGIAPTVSSTVALGLGDAFAMALMRARGFTERDFARLHPGGRLGRILATVGQQMRPIEQLATLATHDSFHQALEAVTRNNFGIAAVVKPDSNNRPILVGAVTDGDVRRALQKFGAEALSLNVEAFMCKKPKTSQAHDLAIDCVHLMEKYKCTSLFVCDADACLVGLLRMHDLLDAKLL